MQYLAVVLLLGFGQWVYAIDAPSPFSLAVKPVYDFVDVEGADFDGSFSIEVQAGFAINERFKLEGSLTGLNNSQSDEECDNTGCYSLTLNSIEVLAGGNVQFFEAGRFNMVGRGGILFYQLDVELEETFYGLKPSGSVSKSDSGSGFYLGVGSGLKLSPQFSLIAELLYRSRRDVFGDSSASFDVNSVGIGIGGRFRF